MGCHDLHAPIVFGPLEGAQASLASILQRISREAAFRLIRRVGLNPNRLTNAWVPFIVASAMLLGRRGRLAMVVPAELLQVSYAAGLRRLLSDGQTYVGKRIAAGDTKTEAIRALRGRPSDDVFRRLQADWAA